MKPIKEKLSKVGLIAHLVNATECSALDVRKVIEALSDTIAASITKGAVGEFALSGVFKVYLRDRKAIKKGTMIRNPGTGEMMPSKGRPASKVVKIRALSGIKKVVVG